jgi:hypothetical protein
MWKKLGYYAVSESLETIFWVKILKFFDADPGSVMEKIGSGIRDKHPGSATLVLVKLVEIAFFICLFFFISVDEDQFEDGKMKKKGLLQLFQSAPKFVKSPRYKEIVSRDLDRINRVHFYESALCMISRWSPKGWSHYCRNSGPFLQIGTTDTTHPF